MYTVYNMKDFDKLAKKAVDKLLKYGGLLYYRSDNWEVADYDFTINIPVELPSEEVFPMLNIEVTLKHITKAEPNQTLTFAEYL